MNLPTCKLPLRLAAIGLGGRGRTYLGLAAERPDLYRVVGGADPNPILVQAVAEASRNSDFRRFTNDAEILSVPQFADVMVVSTQDAQHCGHAIAAMEKGYDILLEKPVATTMPGVLAVESASRRLGRRIVVCHVLRYSPIYRKVKELVDSGRIGRIISINALEGVGAFHHAHSYVRGHWRRTDESSPMIIAKSCHDLDILHWLAGSDCESVSSYGGLDYFTRQNAPEGSPDYCHLGCPINGSCPYDAAYYATTQRKFMYVIADLVRADADPDEIRKAIGSSPWGRCVYQCDNDAVDHQVVAMQFLGGITASLTMTAFARGRGLELYGTEGGIRAGAFCKANTGNEIVVLDIDHNEGECISVDQHEGGYDSHGGGDTGLIEALYQQMLSSDPAAMTTSIHSSVMSHAMGFAADESRRTGTIVQINEFVARFDNSTRTKP